METLQPDALSNCTYPDTHADFARRSLETGAHVFVEKPLAGTVEQARSLFEAAKASGRKVVVGYILRHHPSWAKFVDIARGLGSR